LASQQIFAFYQTEVNHSIHNGPPLFHILSPRFFRFHFDINCPSMPRSSKRSTSRWFTHQALRNISFLSSYCLARSLTHSLAHSLTRSLTHSINQYY